MSLSLYKKKRNFKDTPEPSGVKKAVKKTASKKTTTKKPTIKKAVTKKATVAKKSTAKEAAPIFVIQRHHASHLHYDFRLEHNGTLKSWAVPKGPSLNPKDRRLAMHVEDHPISYASFEGDIPEGNYGAGHVDVWDHGTFEAVDEHSKPISNTAFSKALKEGSIKFKLNGRKLKGEFALVNMKKDDKSWLLIKHRDKYATDDAYDSEDYAKKSSLAYTEARRATAKSPVKKKSGPKR